MEKELKKLREENKRLKKKVRGLELSIEAFKEYRRAFNCLLTYWDSLSKEQHREANRELNKIFKINKEERVDFV